MTRFECRLLRFFNDACIPLFSFNINTQADQVWRTALPTYFALLDLVRQSVFAFACLNLWRFSDLKAILDHDNAITPPMIDPPGGDFTHVFRSLSVLDNTDDSIFTKTASYLTTTVAASEKHILTLDPSGGAAHLDIMFFSSSLIYAFLGLHPHRVIQVVDFDENPPLDILSFASSLFDVLDQPANKFGSCVLLIVGEFNTLKWTGSKNSSHIIAELKSLLNDYFFAGDTFATINSTTSHENEILVETLRILEKCYDVSIMKGYPIPLFRVLFAIPKSFTQLVRHAHPFALRILFVYCCLCVYCGFHLLEQSNIWQDHINLHMQRFGPLCALDRAVNDILVEMKEVSFCRFADSLQEFDAAVMQRLHLLSPDVDQILDFDI